LAELFVSCEIIEGYFISISIKNKIKSAKKDNKLLDIETISKEQLYAQNLELRAQVMELQFQLGEFKRLIFVQKRERFVPSQAVPQATLFSQQVVPVVAPEGEMPKTVTAENVGQKKKGQKAGKPNPNHKGRNEFPAHLPRVSHILVPQVVSQNPLNFNKIGQEITETLDYEPAKLFVLKRIREKYVVKTPSKSPSDTQNAENAENGSLVADNMTIETTETDQILENMEGVFIAPMPDRPLPKAIAEAGLLAQILVDKFVDHLPIDRQTKRWKRESGIDIKGSTIVGWTEQTCQLLMPLYQKLTDLVFDCKYLQADETTLKSLENAPVGKAHTSYQWVYRNVEKGLILFDYQRQRAANCLHPAVKNHQGFLQTDGYAVYEYPFEQVHLSHPCSSKYEVRVGQSC
jgi:transposase